MLNHMNLERRQTSSTSFV